MKLSKIQPPKGFDMTLLQVMTEYVLNMEEIQKLGEATTYRRIANAKIGHQVYYRRSSIEAMFPEAVSRRKITVEPGVVGGRGAKQA